MRLLLRDVAEIPRRRRAHEVADVTHDARFGVALGRFIGLRDVDPARHVDVAARRILVQGRWCLLHVLPVEADLPRERLDRRQRGEHEAEAVARRIRHRAVRAGGHEERRVRLLDTDREDFVLALQSSRGSTVP